MSSLHVIEEPYPLTQQFREAWNELCPRALGTNVFCTLEWMETGWESFAPDSDRLHPLRFENARGETVAMALLRETTVKRAVGQMRCWRTLDYNSQRIVPILAPTPEYFVEALDSLHDFAGGHVDIFDFFKLDPLDEKLFEIAQALEGKGLGPRLELFNEQPQLVLGESWEDARRIRSKNTWRTLRRLHRRTEEEYGPVRFVRLRQPEDFQTADFEKIQQDVYTVFHHSWQANEYDEQAEITSHDYEAYYRLISERLAPLGYLDFTLLYAGDRLLAFDINLVEGPIVYMMFGGFDSELSYFSPGNQLFVRWLEDSHQRGDRVFEFGGDYLEYKEKWTERKIPSYRLRMRGKTAFARLRKAIDKL